MKHAQELQTSIENLVKLLHIIEQEMEEVKAKEKTLSDFDLKLREREKDIEKRSVKVDGDGEKLKMERDFVVQEKNRLAEKEFALGKKEREIEEAKVIFNDLDKKRDEIRMLQEQLSKQLKQVEGLEKERQNIEHLRGMLERESVVDRERKKLLNEQEAHNLTEKDRLQKIADQIDK